ncbi:hypothetical protein AAFF_G00082800 [Aldrovandia affinis]|uniref:Uncharacterized protein n=1 Tax=Aldrovandia affinis TaxID=143900 RepID=A0AAD7RXF8_9TELE|nr:hypothetical protein AAFF_G00082800 [Aldrovandia affinis]
MSPKRHSGLETRPKLSSPAVVRSKLTARPRTRPSLPCLHCLPLSNSHRPTAPHHLPSLNSYWPTALRRPPSLNSYRPVAPRRLPASLLFGQELRTPVDLVSGPPPEPEVEGGPEVDFLRRLQERLKVVHDFTCQAQAGSGVKQKRAYDTRCQGQAFAPGDRGRIFCPSRTKGVSPKLRSRWHRPGEVLQRLSEVVYRVRMPGRGVGGGSTPRPAGSIPTPDTGRCRSGR